MQGFHGCENACMDEYERRIHPGGLKPERAPSEYESLREDIEGIAESITGYAGAATRHALASDRQVELLWSDLAELRDELHALANRVENLTRAITTEPAEVVARSMKLLYMAKPDDPDAS